MVNYLALIGNFGIVLGIIRYYFTYSFIFNCSSKSRRRLTSILSAMELPVAIIVSVIVLREALTILQVGGIVLVLIGMILPNCISSKGKNRSNIICIGRFF